MLKKYWLFNFTLNRMGEVSSAYDRKLNMISYVKIYLFLNLQKNIGHVELFYFIYPIYNSYFQFKQDEVTFHF